MRTATETFEFSEERATGLSEEQLASCGEERKSLNRILASRNFNKAPLLAAFLSYVCEASLADKNVRITEQNIGVKVFRRPTDYDPGEDNIVRNYARQLRKRLEDYYFQEGKDEALRIEIPRGGYMPVFLPRKQADELAASAETIAEATAEAAESAEIDNQESHPEMHVVKPASRSRIWTAVGLFLLVLVCSGVWLLLPHTPIVDANGAGLSDFWRQVFVRNKNTFIVPADTGFVMVQEMDRRTYSLAEYESWPSVEQYNHIYSTYLRTQRYTSVLDLRMVELFDHRPEAGSSRLVIHAARDLKIEDLSEGNAILLGSIYSNPWVEVFQNRLNFRFVYDPANNRSSIVNLHPQSGEQANYGSSWDSYSHNTYAVLAFVPNLSHTGHVLLIQGLDGAGTEAAASLLLNAEAFRPILDRARRRDGSFRGFEVLIDATSVDSHATSPHILAQRLLEN